MRADNMVGGAGGAGGRAGPIARAIQALQNALAGPTRKFQQPASAKIVMPGAVPSTTKEFRDIKNRFGPTPRAVEVLKKYAPQGESKRATREMHMAEVNPPGFEPGNPSVGGLRGALERMTARENRETAYQSSMAKARADSKRYGAEPSLEELEDSLQSAIEYGRYNESVRNRSRKPY